MILISIIYIIGSAVVLFFNIKYRYIIAAAWPLVVVFVIAAIVVGAVFLIVSLPFNYLVWLVENKKRGKVIKMDKR